MRTIWSIPPTNLLRREAAARGVTYERLVEEACERYRRVMEEAGVRAEDLDPYELRGAGG